MNVLCDFLALVSTSLAFLYSKLSVILTTNYLNKNQSHRVDICPSVKILVTLNLNTVYYYYQVMGQMGLTGCKWCDFVVYSDNEFHVERIIFDEDFFSNMMEKLTSFFFHSFVQQLTF